MFALGTGNPVTQNTMLLGSKFLSAIRRSNRKSASSSEHGSQTSAPSERDKNGLNNYFEGSRQQKIIDTCSNMNAALWFSQTLRQRVGCAVHSSETTKSVATMSNIDVAIWKLETQKTK
jgi:hypothetical protein